MAPLTWILLLSLAAHLLLAAALLPPVKTRRFSLTLLQRLLQIAGLAIVIACGVFIVWPDGIPNCVATAVQPLLGYLARFVGKHAPEVTWLVVSTASTLIASPLAILLGFIRKLDALAGMVRRGGGGGGGPTAGRTAPPGPTPDGDWSGSVRDPLDDAVRAMSATVLGRPQANRRRLFEMRDE